MQPFFGFAFPGRCGIIVFRKRTKGFFPRMNGTFDQLHENELPPLKKLEEAGVGFIRITHPAADTMELCRGIGEEYGAKHPKNLFLANKHGTEFFLLLMDAEKPYRTSIVSKKLGSTRLSFGGSEQLHDVLGLRQGSVSVLGMVNECALSAYREGKLHVAIDREVLERELLLVHPNDNRASLVIKTSELMRFLEGMGIVPVILDI